jgi:hypothetical protein
MTPESHAIGSSPAVAYMMVSSSCASMTRASGRSIFCCGYTGLGGPKTRALAGSAQAGEHISPYLRDVLQADVDEE